MPNSRAVAGGVAGLARNFVNQGPAEALRRFNLEGMAGAPAEDVFVALTDMLCPAGGTIDEAINDPDIGEGMTIERRDGGLLYVAFDIDEVTADLEPPAEAGGEEMIAMMAEAFAGHAITMNVAGGEIVETNGTVSADGKTASFSIPLDGLITGAATLPSGFDVLLRPGT